MPRRPSPAGCRAPILTAVNLTPTEVDRLLLHLAASLARARRDRGLRLNVPEATAIIADTVAEAARDGRTHPEAVEVGRCVLGPDDVLPGVADIVTQVHVEAVFDDGSRLVTVVDPIGGGHLGQDAPGALIPGVHRDDEGLHVGAATRSEDTVTRAGRQRVRGADLGLLALPLLRGQPTAAVRPCRRLRASAGRSRRVDRRVPTRGAGRGGAGAHRRDAGRGGLRRTRRRPPGRPGRQGSRPGEGAGLRVRRLRRRGRRRRLGERRSPGGPGCSQEDPACAVPALVRALAERTDRARDGVTT